MILLDTNVVSELMRPVRDPVFAAFVRGQPLSAMFVPSLVVAELQFGMRRLPEGQRRRELERAFDVLMLAGFARRILQFDAACGAGYAAARCARIAAGRPVGVIDALIGGMALTYNAPFVTRNTSDFDGYGLTLLNPWMVS